MQHGRTNASISTCGNRVRVTVSRPSIILQPTIKASRRRRKPLSDTIFMLSLCFQGGLHKFYAACLQLGKGEGSACDKSYGRNCENDTSTMSTSPSACDCLTTSEHPHIKRHPSACNHSQTPRTWKAKVMLYANPNGSPNAGAWLDARLYYLIVILFLYLLLSSSPRPSARKGLPSIQNSSSIEDSFLFAILSTTLLFSQLWRISWTTTNAVVLHSNNLSGRKYMHF